MSAWEDLVEAGRTAFASEAWRAAHDALGAAHEAESLDAHDLWRLAVASFLVGDEDRFVAALQDAHRLCREADDPAGAARHAVWLGLHLINRGDTARASGWFGRAARLIQRHGAACAAEGYLLLADGLRRLSSGDAAACVPIAVRAASLGERFGDRDLFALALHLQGRARVRAGEVERGLAVLDEAMVAVSTGELSPQVGGLIYCGVIGACREVYALRRAHEWTVALTEWCDRQPDMVPYAGECRVYRSELLQLRGDWPRAMDEVVRAGDCFARGSEPRAAGLAHYQRAELHRLRGEFDAAEAAYREASDAGRQPQPGLALLRLAQGKAAAADAGLRRALAETATPLKRARLLPAHIEVLLELDDVPAARTAVRELDRIAGTFGGCLATISAHARGAVALAAGDAAGALAPLRRAAHDWDALDATYEAARARALLGHACRALGDREGGDLELAAARHAFEALGATPDLERLDHGRRTAATEPASGLTPREREVLALVATGRTNRAVAAELDISEKTVARHVANIFRKLGVSTRTEATAFAFRTGLCRPSA